MVYRVLMYACFAFVIKRIGVVEAGVAEAGVWWLRWRTREVVEAGVTETEVAETGVVEAEVAETGVVEAGWLRQGG